MAGRGLALEERFRLLLVTYYFPPSGGAGVQRALKWTKYLPSFGVDPVVLTVRGGAFPQLDPTLGEEVPATVTVSRAPAFDPFGLYARLTGRKREEAVSLRTDAVGSDRSAAERLARWLRANVFIPDARVGWVPFAVARGRMLVQAHRPGAVLSTGPPHSTHLVGKFLQGSRRPWVADFRDPWTDIHYYDHLPRTGLAASVDERLERMVLRRADAVTSVSSSWARLLEEKGARDVTVIPNGYDPEDFAGPATSRSRVGFVIGHVGSLHASRNPEALWQSIARLRQGERLAPIRFRVVGRAGEEVLASAASHDVQVEDAGYLEHAEAVAEMRSAHLLLLSTEAHGAQAGHITGKVYEYLASGTPVLGVGDPTGEAAELLASTGGGRMFARDDVQGIHDFLAQAYRKWERGEAIPGADKSAILRYSRVTQAEMLARLLRGLAAGSDR